MLPAGRIARVRFMVRQTSSFAPPRARSSTLDAFRSSRPARVMRHPPQCIHDSDVGHTPQTPEPLDERSGLAVMDRTWILVRATTRVGPEGNGSALGVLSDVGGEFGACAQSLIFERRPG